MLRKLIYLLSAAPVCYFLARFFVADFSFDEALSLEKFILVPLKTTLTHYPYPNNHIFMSVLENIFLRAVGFHQVSTLLDFPWVPRILPLAFSAIGLFYLFRLTEWGFGRTTAAIAVIFHLHSIPFLNFAVQMRGYALSLALLPGIVWLCLHDVTPYIRRRWGLIVLFSAVLVYAIPLNIYALLAFAFCLGALRQWRCLGALTGGMVLGALGYIPVLKSATQNVYVASQGFFHGSTLVDLMPAVLKSFLSYREILLFAALLGFAHILMTRVRLNRNQKTTLLCSVAVLFLPFIFSTIRGDRPFARVFLNALPFYSILLATGFAFFLRFVAARVPRVREYYCIYLAIAYSAIIFIQEQRHQRFVSQTSIDQAVDIQDIYFNYFQHDYNPHAVVTEYLDHPSVSVAPKLFLFDVAPTPLDHYVRKYEIPYLKDPTMEQLIETYPPFFVIARFKKRFIEELGKATPLLQAERISEDPPGYFNLFKVTSKER